MRTCAVRLSRVVSSIFDGSARYSSTLLKLDARNTGVVVKGLGTGQELDNASHPQTTEGRRLESAEECAESCLYSVDWTLRMSSISSNEKWRISALNDGYQSLRRWLWPGEPNGGKEMESVLLAAPKRKVTPHRKGNRSATKFIRFIPVVSQCSKCQKVFPQHAMPSKCDEEECPAFNVRRNPQK